MLFFFSQLFYIELTLTLREFQNPQNGPIGQIAWCDQFWVPVEAGDSEDSKF